MKWLSEHLLLLVMLGVYSAFMVHHAWIGQRRSKTVLDYFVGGRSIAGWAVAVSFFATYSSTNTFLGFSGKSYGWGVGWFLLVPFAVVLSLFSWLFVAPRLRVFTESLESVTVPDFIGFRFGSPSARVIAAVVVCFSSIIYMTAIFKGVGTLIEFLLGVPYVVAIMVVFVLVVGYTVAGGFHAVVRTDVMQGVLMVLAAVVLFVGTTRAAGGLGTLLDKGEIDPELLTFEAAPPLGILLGILFATTIKFVVEPRQLSRFYALKDPREARKGVWISSALFLVTFSCLAPIGLYAHRIVGSGVQDTDQVVPEMLATGVFGPLATALLFVAILAAAMSSLDSVLLVVATTCQRDLLSHFGRVKDDRQVVRSTRWLVLVFALATAAVAIKPPADIVALTSFSGALYGACFLPAILFGLWWRRGSSASVLASFAGGLGTLFLWPYSPWGDVLHAVFPAVAASVAAYLLVALSGPARGEPEIDRLFSAQPSGEAS
jgi:SSS family transporter